MTRDQLLDLSRLRSEFGRTRADFESMLSADYREVGASGHCWSREAVLQVLDERLRHPVAEYLVVSDFRCQRIAADHYLATYRLDHDGRLSRRATVWRRTSQGWQAVYHQGTLLSEAGAGGARGG